MGLGATTSRIGDHIAWALPRRRDAGQTGPMVSAVIIAVVLIVVIPVGVLISMPLIAAIMGTVLTKDGADRNEGSELVDLNR